MIVTITTFHLKRAASLEEMTKVFQGTAPKYQDMAGLLRKNYWMSEDGLRVGGIYLWNSRGTRIAFTLQSGKNSSRASTA